MSEYQYDRREASVTTPAESYDRRTVTASVKKPLYGHTSMETAYMVDDYPYGSMRCRIRYWLEDNGKKGFRFCSQTENPKNLRWNAPKKSTYMEFAGAMYLDEIDHCVWTGVGIYTNEDKVLEFIKDFPHADFSRLKPWVKAKVKFLGQYAEGKAVFHINNEAKPISEEEAGRARHEAETWLECEKHMH